MMLFKILLIFNLLIYVCCIDEIIVILGNNNPNILQQRINIGLEYLKELKITKTTIYLSGGIKKYSANQITESSLMYDELNKNVYNFKDIQVIMDEKSTNTAENFVYLKKWINKNYLFKEFNYVIITSDYHEKRVMKLFNGIFQNIQPKFVLSNSNCIDCWKDEIIHIKNVENDIKKALLLLN